MYDDALIVKINREIAGHYPTGQVDFVETIRVLMSLATAYQRALETNSPHHANMIAESAKSIAEWMTANKH